MVNKLRDAGKYIFGLLKGEFADSKKHGESQKYVRNYNDICEEKKIEKIAPLSL